MPREIKVLSSFDLWHVSRSANEVAHSCAHRATLERRSCVRVCVWGGANYTLVFLSSILAKDCSPLINQ
jgi:hypothetical protein